MVSIETSLGVKTTLQSNLLPSFLAPPILGQHLSHRYQEWYDSLPPKSAPVSTRNALLSVIGGNAAAGKILEDLLFWYTPSPTGKRKTGPNRLHEDGEIWVARDQCYWLTKHDLERNVVARALKKLIARGLLDREHRLFNNRRQNFLHLRLTAFNNLLQHTLVACPYFMPGEKLGKYRAFKWTDEEAEKAGRTNFAMPRIELSDAGDGASRSSNMSFPKLEYELPITAVTSEVTSAVYPQQRESNPFSDEKEHQQFSNRCSAPMSHIPGNTPHPIQQSTPLETPKASSVESELSSSSRLTGPPPIPEDWLRLYRPELFASDAKLEDMPVIDTPDPEIRWSKPAETVEDLPLLPVLPGDAQTALLETELWDLQQEESSRIYSTPRSFRRPDPQASYVVGSTDSPGDPVLQRLHNSQKAQAFLKIFPGIRAIDQPVALKFLKLLADEKVSTPHFAYCSQVLSILPGVVESITSLGALLGTLQRDFKADFVTGLVPARAIAEQAKESEAHRYCSNYAIANSLFELARAIDAHRAPR